MRSELLEEADHVSPDVRVEDELLVLDYLAQQESGKVLNLEVLWDLKELHLLNKIHRDW